MKRARKVKPEPVRRLVPGEKVKPRHMVMIDGATYNELIETRDKWNAINKKFPGRTRKDARGHQRETR